MDQVNNVLFDRRNFIKGTLAGTFAAKAFCTDKKHSVDATESDVEHHFLTRQQKNIHNRWNKDLIPVLYVHSGDTVTIETRDASDGHYTPESIKNDIATMDSSKVHPLTGPIYLEEAKPGDVLRIDILGYELGEWGWTVTGKGRGFLPDVVSDSYLKIWHYDNDKRYAIFRDGIRVTLNPFCGVMGVAWEETGEFRTIPPRKNGGNMDIKYLTAGTTLYLPVFVKGALFSAGDGHAAQGDGEVCITAIETELNATVKLTVMKNVSINEPQYENNDIYATTGFGTTIIEAAQKATGFMINHLSIQYRLSTDEAYALCSVAMDLKICEAVDMPHYLVSAHIPKSIFV